MSQLKVGILRFLGTNCDRDVWQAVESAEHQPQWLWYQDQFEKNQYSALILPGGFSYGDYLRSGALAAKSPVMKSLIEAAKFGVPIFGICNGFQILCDSGLLPGALVQNEKRRFIDTWVDMKCENPSKDFGGELTTCRLPIAHGDGRYYIDEDTQKQMWDQNQVWWTYEQNPNGSASDIAGVKNKSGNVVGMMPHPERAIFDWMGGSEGAMFFESLES